MKERKPVEICIRESESDTQWKYLCEIDTGKREWDVYSLPSLPHTHIIHTHTKGFAYNNVIKKHRMLQYLFFGTEEEW